MCGCAHRLALVGVVLVVACKRGPEPDAPPPPTAPAGVRAAAVIDSHVHLQLERVADDLARAGVVAAVDLGAPMASVGIDGPVEVLHAGPMLTRPGGYPINAWDPGGYGHGCDTETCVHAAVAAIAVKGGRVIKLVVGDAGLATDLIPMAVAAAHGRGMKVAVHALDDAGARAAADAGCDVLAHTPLERLDDQTVAAWGGRGRAVISTLAAFGGGADAVENLRRLQAADVTVLYGTDLGNLREIGVPREELRLLGEAGLDGPAIVAAMTSAPAAFWGIALPASTYVVLARDPAADPTAYVEPVEVWVEGKRL